MRKLGRVDKRTLLAIAGFFVGATAAFLGIGGGILVIPLLTGLLAIDPRVASGTSLGVIVFVAGTGVAIDLLRGGQPALLAVLMIAPTAMFAARRVAPLITKVPVAVLRRGFAIVLFAAAAKLLGLFGSAADDGLMVYANRGWPLFVVLPLLGLLTGSISALVGIGGGLILIPGLSFLFTDLGPLACRSTSLLIVLPTAFIGFSRHLGHGTARLDLVRFVAPTAMLGAIAGSFAASSVDTMLFQRAFGAFLVFAALRLLWSTRR